MKPGNWFRFILIPLFGSILLWLSHSIVVSQTSELREKERLEELKGKISEISRRLYEEKRKREEMEKLTSDIITIIEGIDGGEIKLKKAKEDVTRLVEGLMRIKEGMRDIGILKEEILKLTKEIEKGEKRIEELERIGKIEEGGTRGEIHRLKEELNQERIRREQEIIKRERIEQEKQELKKDIERLNVKVASLTKELDKERVKRKEMEEVKKEVDKLIHELQQERIENKKVESDKKELKEKPAADVAKPAKEVLGVEGKVRKALSKKDTYQMDVLIIYVSGTSSYLEVLQDYRQSLYLNTRVRAISSDLVEFENLDRYDLIYPDISLINTKNKYKIASALKEYVKDGGALFLEEDFCELFTLPFLGLSTIEIVDLRNQEFTLPEVPHKFKKFQSLWKISSVEFEASRKDKVHSKNLRLPNLKKGAIPSTAISLVNSGSYTLLSINRYEKGWVLWTVNNLPNRGRYLTRFDLGYPDSKAKGFHFGYATLNYLVRNLWLDFLAKERYGFSIQKVYGPYGRPGFSCQFHFEDPEAWEHDSMINLIKTLREKRQIPSFTVLRGSSKVKIGCRAITYLKNVGTDSHPSFIGKERVSFDSMGRRLKMINGEYLTVIQKGRFNSRPSIVDWNGDEVLDLLIGGEDGGIHYYQGVYKGKTKRFVERDTFSIDVGENASPFVCDWNEDGRKDLIVG
ncbi:MAG: FG-GAP-like repeat-containing protein, partial [bacterium]|nr:FG-GAP-like repeat-containing protein [bacterium]